jgi:hypothetical protein
MSGNGAVIQRNLPGDGLSFELQQTFPSAIGASPYYYPWQAASVSALPFTVVSQAGTGDFTDLQSALDSVGAGIFYVTGGYTVSTGLHNSADGQIVIFEPGSTVLFNTIGENMIQVAEDAGNPPTTYYNFCKWIGYDVLISGTNITNNVFDLATKYTGITGSITNVEIAGFYIDNNTDNGGTGNFVSGDVPASAGGDAYGMLLQGQYVHDMVWIGGQYTRNGAVPFQFGLSRSRGERLYADGTLIPSGSDYSLSHVRAGGGANITSPNLVYGVTISDSVFISNGTSGQVSELQGTSGSPTVLTTISDITYSQCIFYSPSSGSVGAGSGGFEIDDNIQSGSTNGVVNNVTFDHCQWHNITVSYQAAGSVFGYIKYNGQMPSTSGTMTGRSPGSQVSISVGASPFTYTNNDGIDEWVFVTAGTVSAIALDGVTVFAATGHAVYLHAGHYAVVTYSAAPTMSKQGIGG